MQRAWLTPVELFQPWYAQAVARYIVRDHQQRSPRQPLHIVEVGGGHGTLAAGILVRPPLYSVDGQSRPVHRTFQNCFIYFQGVYPNNSARLPNPVVLPLHAKVDALCVAGIGGQSR